MFGKVYICSTGSRFLYNALHYKTVRSFYNL